MNAAHEIELLSGEKVPLALRHSTRARRISLRLMPGAGAFELVIPKGCSEREALGFAATKRDWIALRLRRLDQPVPFTEGAAIPFRGEFLTIERADGLLRPVEPTASRIYVAPDETDIAGAVQSWLRDSARERLNRLARDKTARIGRAYKRLTLRDGKTRWGSCSARGNLNFSWRIIMAPDVVSDYLVAHEVAHLVEMNHSNRFWALCDELSADMETGRDWLRQNGPGLHRYGP